MTMLAPLPVASQDWRSRPLERNGPPRSSLATVPAPRPECPAAPDRWEAIIDAIVAMQHLGDNWDGLGAAAPSRELLESAVGLASLLRDAGADAPTAAIQGTDGSVNFLWHAPDGTYCEVEIDRPLHADVMLLEPGKEPRHWQLPNA
jgi:hypothetical protein